MSKISKMTKTYAKPDDLSGRSSKWELLWAVLESWQLSHGDAKGGQMMSKMSKDVKHVKSEVQSLGRVMQRNQIWSKDVKDVKNAKNGGNIRKTR